MADSLIVTLKEALDDAETSSELGDDYKAYLRLKKAVALALNHLDPAYSLSEEAKEGPRDIVDA